MIFLCAFLGGILSGILNTLASSGSAVTLPLLVFLGVHDTMANATNRLGIIFGTVTSVWVFHRKGLLNWRLAGPIASLVTLGAALGALVASRISDHSTHEAITVAIVVAFLLILLGSKRFMRETQGEPRPVTPLRALLLLAVGFWTGFIVLDSATYMLLSFVLAFNINLTHANPIKALCLLACCSISTLIFAAHGQVRWDLGLALGFGNVLGSWGAAHFASRPESRVWVFRLLVLVVAGEILALML